MPNVKYLYAIMDDKSRFIVGWKLLTRKKAEDCVEVIKSAINTLGLLSFMEGQWRGKYWSIYAEFSEDK